jgi:hypothetical protein
MTRRERNEASARLVQLAAIFFPLSTRAELEGAVAQLVAQLEPREVGIEEEHAP